MCHGVCIVQQELMLVNYKVPVHTAHEDTTRVVTDKAAAVLVLPALILVKMAQNPSMTVCQFAVMEHSHLRYQSKRLYISCQSECLNRFGLIHSEAKTLLRCLHFETILILSWIGIGSLFGMSTKFVFGLTTFGRLQRLSSMPRKYVYIPTCSSFKRSMPGKMCTRFVIFVLYEVKCQIIHLIGGNYSINKKNHFFFKGSIHRLVWLHVHLVHRTFIKI